jgi:hypothetical protein
MKTTACSLLSLSLLACGASATTSTDPDPGTVDTGLAADYGGQTMTADTAALADPEAVANFGETLPPTGDPTTDDRADLAGARRVRGLVAWGYLRPHPDATEVVDWSGTLSVTNAAIHLVRPARFETATDHVIVPRPDIQTLGFDSKTRPAWDGLLIDVVLAPALNPTAGDVVLTLDTPVASESLTIEDGMRGTTVDTVDAAGHKIAFHVIRPDHDGCAEGFLLGRWNTVGQVSGHEVGVFFGRFLGAGGERRAVVKGIFGERRDGTKVFFGKIIDRNGNALGLVAGRYGDGKFGGRLLGDGRVVEGAVRGRYADRNNDGDGFFAGRWSKMCGERSDEGTPDAGDEAAEDLSLN